MRILICLVAIMPAFFCQGQVYFTESAEALGIEEVKTEPSIGNGVSLADFDGDGRDDLTLGTQQGKPLAFYRNIGGAFERLPSLVDHQGDAKQVLWVDFDNDGDKDLHVTTFMGISRLYRNEGDLTFTDITAQAGLPLTASFAYGSCWGDVDRDGWLDFYTVDHDFNLSQGKNRLFHNNGDGTFTEITFLAGAADRGKLPFCSAFLDFNNDNWPDLYTANDKLTYNTLLMNNGDGTFTDVSAATQSNLRMNAMCVAVGDYDNNGWQDIYITNTPVGNALLHNEGLVEQRTIPRFRELAAESGTGFYGNGWGSNFLDADNDGKLDLYVSGSVDDSEKVSSLFYYNTGNGQFTIPADAGFAADTVRSFTNAVGDVDQNGFPDIFVQNNPPYPHQLWLNEGADRNWIKIKLEGVLSNRDAVGAKIEAYTDSLYQQRYRHCGIGFLGQNSETEIIGLDDHNRIDSLIITWPSGHQDRFFDLQPNQLLQVSEGMSTGGEIYVDPELDLATSLDSPAAISPSVQLFPNPGGDRLHIRFDHTASLHFRILDPLGRAYRQGQLNGSPASISFTGMKRQLYIVELRDERGRKTVRKWLKMD